MNKSVLRAIQGGVLALGAPLGWLLINLYSGASLVDEIKQNVGLYSYLLFVTVFVFIMFGIFVGRKEELISMYAVRDTLTGIYNLRYYSERLNNEISSAKRYHTPLSLIYFDLDHFKKVNDEFGHPAGDEVLRQVTKAITNISRVNDIFARVGGEEFVLLLPRSTLANALADAERIRQTIQALTIPINNKPDLKITISLGVVTLIEGETASDFYKRADQNLYLAKEQGRNRVVG